MLGAGELGGGAQHIGFLIPGLPETRVVIVKLKSFRSSVRPKGPSNIAPEAYTCKSLSTVNNA